MITSRLSSKLALATLLYGCGASPAPAAVPVATPSAAAVPVSHETVPAAPMPSSVVAWMHIESPKRLVPAATEVLGPSTADASCAKGDFLECLAIIDSSRPVDVAAGTTGSGDDATALGFSIPGVAEFRDKAEKLFVVTDAGSHLLRLEKKKGANDSKDADGPAHPNKDQPDLCDLGDAEGPQHRVVCGNKDGLATLGPWLRTSPARPTPPGELASIEIYAGPTITAIEKELPQDKPSNAELRELARAFGGATIHLGSADKLGRVKVDLDVRMKGGHSRWTNVLLTPPTASGPIPDSFARLPRGTTAALYFPGGGPLVALLDQVDALSAVTALSPAQMKSTLEDVRTLLRRPSVVAYLIDFDEAQASLAQARKATDKNRKAAETAMGAAFASHVIYGMQEPIQKVEELARKLIAAAASSSKSKNAIRPAQNLGLPKGSFILESIRTEDKTTAKAGAAKGGPAKITEDTLVVPDGDTTWLVFGEDVHLTARLATRLMARPRGTVTGFDTRPGTLATGYLTSLLGAFFLDVETHDIDALNASLATSAPGLLDVALSQHLEGSDGSLTLSVESDAPTLKTLGLRALPLVFVAAGVLALASSALDSTSK